MAAGIALLIIAMGAFFSGAAFTGRAGQPMGGELAIALLFALAGGFLVLVGFAIYRSGKRMPRPAKAETPAGTQRPPSGPPY